MDKAERFLKEVLKGRGETGGISAACPSERELWAYLEGTLGPQEEAVSRHVADCDSCLESLLLAQEVRPGLGFDPVERLNEALIRKVKEFSTQQGPEKGRGPFWKHRWLFLALGCLSVSFFIPRYFLQFLLLTSIFGAKWVFDSATNRTLIVLYEAWKKKDEEKDKEELSRRR